MKHLLAAALVAAAVPAFAQPMPPEPPPRPHRFGPPDGLGFGEGPGPQGIPPHLAQRIGVSPDVVAKSRTLALDAAEALIPLEADVKRAQLAFDRLMGEPSPDEGKVMAALEAVAKAKLAVHKNRVGLLLKTRKLIGPEAWAKLQAEAPPFGPPGAPRPPPPPRPGAGGPPSVE